MEVATLSEASVKHDISSLFLNIVHIAENKIVATNIEKRKIKTNRSVGFVVLKLLTRMICGCRFALKARFQAFNKE